MLGLVGAVCGRRIESLTGAVVRVRAVVVHTIVVVIPAVVGVVPGLPATHTVTVVSSASASLAGRGHPSCAVEWFHAAFLTTTG